MQIRKLRQGQAVQRRGQPRQNDFKSVNQRRFGRLPCPEQGQNQSRDRQPRAARARREGKPPGSAQVTAEPEQRSGRVFDEQQEKKNQQASVGCLHDQQEGLGKRGRQKGAAEALVKHVFQTGGQQQEPGRKLDHRPDGQKKNKACKDVRNNKKRGDEKSHGFFPAEAMQADTVRLRPDRVVTARTLRNALALRLFYVVTTKRPTGLCVFQAPRDSARLKAGSGPGRR